jgi:predicted porin
MLLLKPSKKTLKEGINMKKSLLAMAALMGVATLPAHAWRVNIDKDTFADIGFSNIVRGISEGKRSESPNEKSRINFFVPLFNITASGQVNKLVYFSMNAEGGSTSATLGQNTIRVRDSFIGLKFADELRVQAGVMRVPFSRVALTSAYVQLFPYTPRTAALRVDPTDVEAGDFRSRDHGIVVWGNVADGLVKYYLGVTDGETINKSTDDSLAYTVRVQFTPVMLGFKPETGYTVSDTYLGRQNVLSIGFGYRVVGRGGAQRDTKMLTVDALYEQKFGDLVPNLQVGLINKKDAGGVANRKASQLYIQGGVLFDQMVGFGKPALAVRLEQNKNELPGAPANQDEPKVNRLGVWAHYYIKGQDAKVSLGLDSVRLNSEARNRDCDPDTPGTQRCRNFTDITLQFQTRF